MNPLDEYLEMRKEAFKLPIGMGTQLAGVGMTMGLGAAAAHAIPVADKIYGAITKRRDFNEMMETNPDLQELQAEDDTFFNQAYSSLRRVNPTFGRDPIIAGSYMKKMMINKDQAGLTLAQSVKAPDAGGPAVGRVPTMGIGPLDMSASTGLREMQAGEELSGMAGGGYPDPSAGRYLG